jgi:hypothetical protein
MKTKAPTLRILALSKGQPPVLPPQAVLPGDLTPGEVLMIPDTQGKDHWFIFCDKQRGWSNGRWNMGGTLAEFDPNQMTEAEIFEYRRTLLQECGWIL